MTTANPFAMTHLANLITTGDVPLPFAPLPLPRYRPWSRDGWVLADPGSHPPLARGYFRGLQYWPKDQPNWLLTHNGKIWMSLSPMELESQGHHAAAARGRVLIGGLGMGVLLATIIRKRNVREVVVVEREKGIIEMVQDQALYFGWRGRTKVKYVHEDMLEYRGDGKGFDVGLIDIWPSMGDMAVREDMRRIANNVRAEAWAAWTQELDFISWCSEQGIDPDGIKPKHWNCYSAAIGVPLLFQNTSWIARLSMAAAENLLMA